MTLLSSHTGSGPGPVSLPLARALLVDQFSQVSCARAALGGATMSDNHPMLGADDEAEPIAEVLRTITSALARTRAVKRFDDDTLSQRAHDQLDAADTAARDAGLTIGATLGMARGNAYQRYRHQPPAPHRPTR